MEVTMDVNEELLKKELQKLRDQMSMILTKSSLILGYLHMKDDYEEVKDLKDTIYSSYLYEEYAYSKVSLSMSYKDHDALCSIVDKPIKEYSLYSMYSHYLESVKSRDQRTSTSLEF